MTGPAPTPREVADRYVQELCRLDPLVATSLGDPTGADRLPDPSPDGLEARAELARRSDVLSVCAYAAGSSSECGSGAHAPG